MHVMVMVHGEVYWSSNAFKCFDCASIHFIFICSFSSYHYYYYYYYLSSLRSILTKSNCVCVCVGVHIHCKWMKYTTRQHKHFKSNLHKYVSSSFRTLSLIKSVLNSYNERNCQQQVRRRKREGKLIWKIWIPSGATMDGFKSNTSRNFCAHCISEHQSAIFFLFSATIHVS